MKKTITKWIMAFVCLILLSSVHADAATKKETSKNNGDLKHAQTIGTNDTINGRITKDDNDFYKIKVAKGSSVQMNLKLTSYIYRVRLRIYNSKGNNLYDSYVRWNDNIKKVTEDYTFYLDSGTYYIGVESEYYSYTGKYQVRLNSKKLKNNDLSQDNTMAKAKSINLNKKYKGVLALGDNSDVYKLKITDAGEVKLNFTTYIPKLVFKLLDSQGNTVYSDYVRWNDNIKSATHQFIYYFEPGIYYFQVYKDDYSGIYEFSNQFTSIGSNEKENNNTIANAQSISSGETINGLIGDTDESDIYKINSNGSLYLDITSYISTVNFYVYDSNGNVVKSDYIRRNDNIGYTQENYEIDLEPGTYYIQLLRNYSKTGKYRLTAIY